VDELVRRVGRRHVQFSVEHKGLQRHTKAYKGMQRHTQAYNGIQGHTRAYKGIQSGMVAHLKTRERGSLTNQKSKEVAQLLYPAS
jgi:hypothetical protein